VFSFYLYYIIFYIFNTYSFKCQPIFILKPLLKLVFYIYINIVTNNRLYFNYIELSYTLKLGLKQFLKGYKSIFLYL